MYYSVHFFRLLTPDPVPIHSLTSLIISFDRLSLLVFPWQTSPSMLRQNFFLLRISLKISLSFLCSRNLKATQLMPEIILAV